MKSVNEKCYDSCPFSIGNQCSPTAASKCKILYVVIFNVNNMGQNICSHNQSIINIMENHSGWAHLQPYGLNHDGCLAIHG